MRQDVIIVGGGIAGITAALHLAEAGVGVFLTMSKTLEKLCPAEVGLACDVDDPDLAALFGAAAVPRISYRVPENIAADIASGTFPVDGAVICPASTGFIGRPIDTASQGPI